VSYKFLCCISNFAVLSIYTFFDTIQEGLTALHFAAHADMTKLLLESKADPHQKDDVRIMKFVYVLVCICKCVFFSSYNCVTLGLFSMCCVASIQSCLGRPHSPPLCKRCKYGQVIDKISRRSKC